MQSGDNVAESKRGKAKPVDTEQEQVCAGDEPATAWAAQAPSTRPENRGTTRSRPPPPATTRELRELLPWEAEAGVCTHVCTRSTHTCAGMHTHSTHMYRHAHTYCTHMCRHVHMHSAHVCTHALHIHSARVCILHACSLYTHTLHTHILHACTH